MQSRSRPYGRIFGIFHLIALFFGLIAVPVAAQPLVLALGDSLTAGYQLKPGESFPARLETTLRAQGLKVSVHNAGVSGDTTAQAKARLAWVLNGLKQKPDVAIVALGANDMLRGQKPADARANLDSILSEFERRGIPVILAGMLASPNMGAVYARDFNAIYPALAKKHGATLYPFFTRGVTANRALLLADGMHPNAEGTKVMARNMAPVVIGVLAKAR